MNFAPSISTLLDGVRDAYIKDQKDKGIYSSGKSASSIRKDVEETSGQLFGSSYFYQQKHGRKPGKFPPIDDILNWIRAKGIQPGMYQPTPKTGQKIPKPRQMTERQLAFLFAQKIAREGTDIFQGKRPELDPGEQIQKLVMEFSRSVSKELRKEIKAIHK